MTIQCDTREHKAEWERIRAQFEQLRVDYIRSKLWVGDYMDIDRPRLVIDRKKDLQELCGNITTQHERFRNELIRAKDKGIKLIILCEHGKGIERLADVHFWHNPRLDMSDWMTVNGHPEKRKKYPKAVEGKVLYKSLCTIRDRYGVDILFCDKKETGYQIVKLLEGG